FVRDVGSLVQPGDSAIFALIETSNPAVVAARIEGYGGKVLRLALPPAQAARVGSYLRDRSAGPWPVTRGPVIKQEKPMSTETNTAKKAVEDTIEAKVKTAQAKLDTLKLKAEAAKAVAEVAAIAELLKHKRTINQKLADLKKSGEGKYQQAKADLE